MHTFRLKTAIFSIVVGLSASQASGEARLGQDIPEILEYCFSDDPFERGACYGYMKAMENSYHRGFPRNDVACYFGEVLALRNVAIHGWQKILESLAWADSPEGRAEILERGGTWAQNATTEFAQRALHARDAIRERRDGGALPLACAISLRIQGVWYDWQRR